MTQHDNTSGGDREVDVGTDDTEDSPADRDTYHYRTTRGPSDPPQPPAYTPADSMSDAERETFDFESQNLDELTEQRTGVISYLGREWHIAEPDTISDTLALFDVITGDAQGDAALVRRAIAICVTDVDRTSPTPDEMTPYQLAVLGTAVVDWLDLQSLVDELGSLSSIRENAAAVERSD